MARDKAWFDGDLDLRHLKEPIDGKWFKLLAAFEYWALDGEVHMVPKWTLTDFASIPKPMRAVISRVGWHSQPSVLHDWLCEKKIVPRWKADRLYKESLKVALREFIGLADSWAKRTWRRKGWIKLRTLVFGVRAYTIVTFKK